MRTPTRPSDYFEVYAVVHRGCGHIQHPTSDRGDARRHHSVLVAAGDSQWRVRCVPNTALTEYLRMGSEGETCPVCRFGLDEDPE